ncbi:hypothetical protein NA57DRAFT_67277 [Rhizodiscina lignyota]|uniref:DUF3752 domain-containing protein n=1 Tax=Rhizodiscina lignyota TaxID=1504668 RepID=A0A9P4IBC9_9PEZI|nr:hypothetical protein NA57DRAFT_67277 [Rhizodiscina lignyota]
MPTIGPTLPPHLQSKRKHEDEDEDESSDEESVRKPQSPNGDKRRKVVGPAPPPAPLDERPPQGPDSEGDSSSEDDYGPALPTGPPPLASSNNDRIGPQAPPPEPEQKASARVARDSWMLNPPQQDDLAARMDPTKIRARKFNTGKGARGPTQGSKEIDSIWTETPEQKVKRLRDEMMGVSKAKTGPEASRVANKKEDQETARRLREQSEKSRGESLFEQHKKMNKKEEDDPSKRAFDYQKDMAGGTKIGHAQRKEILNRAKDFESKFSSGGFL